MEIDFKNLRYDGFPLDCRAQSYECALQSKRSELSNRIADVLSDTGRDNTEQESATQIAQIGWYLQALKEVHAELFKKEV